MLMSFESTSTFLKKKKKTGGKLREILIIEKEFSLQFIGSENLCSNQVPKKNLFSGVLK